MEDWVVLARGNAATTRSLKKKEMPKIPSCRWCRCLEPRTVVGGPFLRVSRVLCLRCPWRVLGLSSRSDLKRCVAMSNSKRWPHAKCSWPQVKVMWIASTTSCGCHLTSLSSWTAFLSGFFPKHLVKSCCWLPNATLCVGAQQKAWSMRSAGTSLCSMCAEGWRRWESEAAKKPGQIWSGFKPPGN